MIDAHTLDKLAFDHLREVLASACACRLGKDRARAIVPAVRAEPIRCWLEQVRQMAVVADDAGLPPLGGVYDIQPEVRRAGLPSGLEVEELRRVSETLSATSNIHRWSAALPEEADMIRAAANKVGDFGPVAAQIDRAIDDRGQVRDDASRRLREVRRTIENLRNEIQVVYARILRRPNILRILQFPNTTVRGERTVLPLKTEFRGQLKGIVHQSSDTGSTLFIEPTEAVQANNAIVRLHEDERKEIARILTELSFVVHENQAGILDALSTIGLLDLIAAKVRYMKTHNAVCPEISDDQRLVIHQARHPILLDLATAEGRADTVVPIDVRLGDDFDVLVITGPNTGGKTVTLKTVGLLAVMAQCGIPIPAGPGSVLPVYRQIHLDVGDEQSIEQSLSTFSAHLSNILSVLRHANPHTLVLFDELGSGTDPDEGAAIGRAILDELLRIGCRAIVTTHLSSLKAVAIANERVDNASVEFDVESLRPTYHLRIGEPGNSNAIAIAQRLGMSKRMVKNARSYLSKKGQAIQNVIEATLDSRRQSEQARAEAHRSLLEAEQQRIHYEREARRLEEERESQRRWYEWLSELSPGDEVYVCKFNRRAKVIRLHLQRQSALIDAGTLDMEVALSELRQPEDGTGRA